MSGGCAGIHAGPGAGTRRHYSARSQAPLCIYRGHGAADYRDSCAKRTAARIIVMNSKHIGADINYAWPTAEIAVMGPRGAAEVIYRKEIQNPAIRTPTGALMEKEQLYRKTFVNPFLAAKRGYIDDVIFPGDTRLRLIRSLQFLEGKKNAKPDTQTRQYSLVRCDICLRKY